MEARSEVKERPRLYQLMDTYKPAIQSAKRLDKLSCRTNCGEEFKLLQVQMILLRVNIIAYTNPEQLQVWCPTIASSICKPRSVAWDAAPAPAISLIRIICLRQGKATGSDAGITCRKTPRLDEHSHMSSMLWYFYACCLHRDSPLLIRSLHNH